MRGDFPLVGSTRERLLSAGLVHFCHNDFRDVDVDAVAAQAGVTVGSLYHHFTSKLSFYGFLRDEMAKRLLDRMEAAADAVPREAGVKAALLAGFDGSLKLRIGRLITDPDPRAVADPIAALLTRLLAWDEAGAGVAGHILAAALRAAVRHAGKTAEHQARARETLARLIN